MKDYEIMKRAIQLYGPKAQEIKAVEELSELSQAICKVINAHDHPSMNNLVECTTHMFEEIADVEIMLEQIRIIFSDASVEVEVWKQKKLARLSERLGVRTW